MRLIVDKIVAEFNKIFAGTKRVGDSLRLEGKRESELSVLNSSQLGSKTESTLNVNHSVFSDNAEKIRSVNINGDPDVYIDENGNTQPLFKTEQNLSVHNAQMLRDVAPLNLEVDISRRLKVGDKADSPVISVSSLITNPATYTVRDSSLLSGKTESQLDVNTSVNANNANLLNNTTQDNLVVKEANQALFLKRSNGDLIAEEDLYAKSAELFRKGASSYDLFEYRNYVLTHPDAKKIIPDLASSSSTLTTSNGNKSWSELQTLMKDGTDSEIYKTSHIIVTSDTSAPVKTGDEFKSWMLSHDDFAAKVLTLTSNIAKRAIRFGSSTESYDLDGMKTLITGTTVTLAANSNKLQNNTVDDIISTTRSRVLSDASNTSTGLTQNEVDGFFDNTKVKAKVQTIKVNNAIDSDTLEGNTTADIKNQVKAEGDVLSAKYLWKDPSTGGQVSYLTITSDIETAVSDLIDNASLPYRTFGKIENIIDTNKTDIENKLASEITNRTTSDNNLGNRIDTEKGRIDTIVDIADDSDPDTFKKMKVYSDDVTNALDKRVGDNEAAIADLESSTNSSSESTQSELNNTQNGAGLDSDGNYIVDSDRNYIDSATSLADADKLLDIQLAVEAQNRSDDDNVLLGKINTNAANLDSEITNRKNVDGDLTTLTTSTKTNLVAAINELQSGLDSEIEDRGTADTTLDDKISNTNSDLKNETSLRKTADTNLQDNIDKVITNLNNEINVRKDADNTLQNNIDTVDGNLSSEANTRETNDKTLQDNIDTVVSDLAKESNTRTSNDNDLQDNIDTVNNALKTEISNRDTNDKALQTNIDNTNTRINNVKVAIGGINEDDGTVTFSGTNFIDGDTTINAAMVELDARAYSAMNSAISFSNQLQDKIDTETNDRKSADDTLTTNLNTEISDRKSADDTLTTNLNDEITRAKDSEFTLQSNKVDKVSQLISDMIITTDTTAVVGTRYYVDVSAGEITITLPSPNNFDKILFHGLSGDFTTNNLTINADSNDTIMTSSDPLIVDTNNETFTLVFVNNDWRIL